VRRYVDSIFSDAYLTTVGVKIDKKVVSIGAGQLAMILWDLAGEDEAAAIRASYLRGAAGYLLVADGTRPETLEAAASIQARISKEVGSVPFFVLLNKADLQEEWAIPASRIETLEGTGWIFRRTSAKTGDGVEATFEELAARVAR
jgi:small GTP-binding protein